jgi:hypothetical protein
MTKLLKEEISFCSHISPKRLMHNVLAYAKMKDIFGLQLVASLYILSIVLGRVRCGSLALILLGLPTRPGIDWRHTVSRYFMSFRARESNV